MTITTDTYAERLYAALHAPCRYYRRRRGRLRECNWAPSGYCHNCGRPIPTTIPDQAGTIR